MPVYIAEIAPQNLRGGLGSVNQVEILLLLLDESLAFLFLLDLKFIIHYFCNFSGSALYYYWHYAGLSFGPFCQLESACNSR